MLSSGSIIKFQQLFFAEYGESLSEAEARERGERLVNLYRAVYLPKKYFPIKEVKYEEAH